MAVTRRDILTNATAMKQYCDGVNALKNEFTGPTTASLGIPGPPQKVSTYDLFVIWHHTAMMTPTPPNGTVDRNAAHKGPVFCPWHRFMLRQLELNLQRVLQDDTFGLPYWDWAADGQLPVHQQTQSKLWAANGIGGSGSPVTTGPFALNAADPKSFRVRVESAPNLQIRQVNRGLRRRLAGDLPDLPTKTQTSQAVAVTPYDAAPWTAQSPSGFRNRLEGWIPNGPALHNRVHVWIGGDMSPASSPNDPVFFLNHCNVDRLWEAWMNKHGRAYLPDQTASNDLKGHRINDQLSSLVSAPTTPAAVLDSTSQYTYDSLSV
jgi:tyrosinase